MKASADATAKKQQAIEEKNSKFRGENDQLHGNLVTLEGKVLQILKEGVLLTDARFHRWEFKPDGELDVERTYRHDATPFGDLVYLEANPNSFFDGDSVDESFACKYGAFTYTSSAGIKKKIRAFTLDREHGLEYAHSNP